MAVPIDPEDPVGGGGGGGGDVPLGTAIFQFQFNKDEDESVMRVLAYAALSSADDLVFQAYLLIDGIVRQAARVNAVFDNKNSKAAMPVTLPAYLAGLDKGPHSIMFSIRNMDTSGAALTVLTGSTIEVTELKKAAV